MSMGLSKEGMPDSDDLIQELVDIGKLAPGDPPDGCSHFLEQANGRAREIGETLSELGGLDLMLAARGAIQSRLGRSAAHELETAWQGVGDWQD